MDSVQFSYHLSNLLYPHVTSAVLAGMKYRYFLLPASSGAEGSGCTIRQPMLWAGHSCIQSTESSVTAGGKHTWPTAYMRQLACWVVLLPAGCSAWTGSDCSAGSLGHVVPPQFNLDKMEPGEMKSEWDDAVITSTWRGQQCRLWPWTCLSSGANHRPRKARNEGEAQRVSTWGRRFSTDSGEEEHVLLHLMWRCEKLAVEHCLQVQRLASGSRLSGASGLFCNWKSPRLDVWVVSEVSSYWSMSATDGWLLNFSYAHFMAISTLHQTRSDKMHIRDDSVDVWI